MALNKFVIMNSLFGALMFLTMVGMSSTAAISRIQTNVDTVHTTISIDSAVTAESEWSVWAEEGESYNKTISF
jgi:hypothetical protein